MPDTDPLLTLLRDTDASCPRCHYNLRGIDNPACPECGHPITFAELTNRDHRVSLAWIITLVAYAAALPWSVFFVWQRLFIRHSFYYGREYGRPTPSMPEIEWPDVTIRNPWFVLSYIYWLSVPLVVLVLVICRRRFECLPRRLQWTTSVFAAVLTVLAYRRWQWWYLPLTIGSVTTLPSDSGGCASDAGSVTPG